jgi:hypothetical protein
MHVTLGLQGTLPRLKPELFERRSIVFTGLLTSLYGQDSGDCRTSAGAPREAVHDYVTPPREAVHDYVTPPREAVHDYVTPPREAVHDCVNPPREAVQGLRKSPNINATARSTAPEYE